MDKQSQEKFDALMKVGKGSLNKSELEFLMARRDYMSDEQRKAFKEEIDLHEDGELFPTEKSLEDMNVKELKAFAKENEIDIAGMKKEDEIRDAIKEAQDADAE